MSDPAEPPRCAAADLLTVRVADDLPRAFETLPAAWRDVLKVGWADAAQAVCEGVRRVSQDRPIAPTDPFRALRLVSPEAVRVVIVGQDPYPTAGQADGLAFSAEKVSPRPALRRIFEVLEADRPGWRRPVSGRLDGWATQGVLLLNTALSVEVGRAGSHLQVGWQALTYKIVEAAARIGPEPVFLLWGNHAASFIDEARARVAESRPKVATGQGPGAPLTTWRTLLSRHPSNDYRREFMARGSHFVATAQQVDWWCVGGKPS